MLCAGPRYMYFLSQLPRSTISLRAFWLSNRLRRALLPSLHGRKIPVRLQWPKMGIRHNVMSSEIPCSRSHSIDRGGLIILRPLRKNFFFPRRLFLLGGGVFTFFFKIGCVCCVRCGFALGFWVCG